MLWHIQCYKNGVISNFVVYIILTLPLKIATEMNKYKKKRVEKSSMVEIFNFVKICHRNVNSQNLNTKRLSGFLSKRVFGVERSIRPVKRS
jgi:hypothetical protein